MLRGVWNWLEDRTGLAKAMGPLLRHPVPPNTDWRYVFGSGTLVAFTIQVVTGIGLATMYVPAADNAYASLTFITHQAFLGYLIRGMHYWGAAAMIVLLGAHMLRIYLMGSYKFPREVNWLAGVISWRSPSPSPSVDRCCASTRSPSGPSWSEPSRPRVSR